MRKYLMPITVCAVVFGGQMAYGKPVTSMSMAGPYGTPAFGQVVSFDVTWENVLGKEWPLFAVNCFRDLNGDGVVNTTGDWNEDGVYGELRGPDGYEYADQAPRTGSGTATFLLGGCWSPWWDKPGPATCVAQAWAYSRSGETPHGDPIVFAAAG